jgi:hypothetical protein
MKLQLVPDRMDKKRADGEYKIWKNVNTKTKNKRKRRKK